MTRLFVSVPYVVAAMMVVSAYKQLGPPRAFGEPPLVKAESSAIKSPPASISGALLVNDDIFGEEERAEDVSWKSYVHAPPTTSNGAKLTVADRLTGLVETDPRVGPLEAKLTMEATSSSQAIVLSEASPLGITPMRNEPTMAAFPTSGTRQAKLDLGATQIQDQTVEHHDLRLQIRRNAAEADAWLARLQAQGQDLQTLETALQRVHSDLDRSNASKQLAIAALGVTATQTGERIAKLDEGLARTNKERMQLTAMLEGEGTSSKAEIGHRAESASDEAARMRRELEAANREIADLDRRMRSAQDQLAMIQRSFADGAQRAMFAPPKPALRPPSITDIAMIPPVPLLKPQEVAATTEVVPKRDSDIRVHQSSEHGFYAARIGLNVLVFLILLQVLGIVKFFGFVKSPREPIPAR